MADKILADIYGRGWAFPLQFSSQEGVIMAAGAEHVRQSMKILFLTEPGERIMREDYGCGLNDYMFENISDELMAGIQTRIEERILRYEPRAEMTEIKVNQKTDLPNTLHIQVKYALRGSEIIQQIEGILEIGEGPIEVSYEQTTGG
ncbi:GPW/gp25 family protein [Photorhabdus luminescens]|uniref:Phage baseplate protein n=1 Tax=Photorhabdus luminescens subsp. sonorensis TaxID=1173677 RepID=A0A5C4RH42_PHOLU|nr:GPW/gp25 family protein [Photorhabdus luminescens]TNH43074.1 phage baseplate protein [Photorhabdus luminescens subsp. sonorensis]